MFAKEIIQGATLGRKEERVKDSVDIRHQELDRDDIG
jgi:hypothetical protein